jgi:hypothetical protein
MAIAKKKVAKKKAAPAPKALSGVEIEKELSLAHKAVARAAATLSIMLAVRKLSVTRIGEASVAITAAADQVNSLIRRIK